jgi:hypothetical protein
MYVLEEHDGEEDHDEDSEDDFYEERVSTHNGSEVDDAGDDDNGNRQ